MRPCLVKTTECEAVWQALREGRGLTAAEAAHAEKCTACADAAMERDIEVALEARPEAAVPADFAARVAVRAQDEKSARRWARQKLAGAGWLGRMLGRHPGRNAAVGLLLAMMVVVTMRDPQWLTATGTVRMTLMLVLAGEMAGIALWLGLRSEM